MGCGCLFAIFAGFAPRVALLLIWLFTNLVDRAFTGILWPLLGIIFLPFTTIMYVLVWVPGVGVTGWRWVWVVVGVLLDIGSYGSSAARRRAAA
jgi:hypothetical protein